MTPIQILLVEDSPSDRLLAEHALAAAKLANELNWVEDGVEALAFLRCEGKYANAPRPDLILLDLNLPRKSGIEVLAEVKTDASLRTIPIVVLTTSSADDDAARAYVLHANCVVAKPVDFQRFAEVIQSISEFWSMVVRLPPKG